MFHYVQPVDIFQPKYAAYCEEYLMTHINSKINQVRSPVICYYLDLESMSHIL